MEYLKDKLLEVITEALPETDDMIEFCGSDSFVLMLDTIMKTIVVHIFED